MADPHSPSRGDGSQNPIIPNDLAPQSDKKRFKCPIPDCRKLFNRKEHVTRHLKSHNPNAEHQCHICGRRFVRSDVLRRHMAGHAPPPKTSGSLTPTTSIIDQQQTSEANEDESHDMNPCFYHEPEHGILVEGSDLWNDLRTPWAHPQSQSGHPWQPSVFSNETGHHGTGTGDINYGAEWANTLHPSTCQKFTNSTFSHAVSGTNTPGRGMELDMPPSTSGSSAETVHFAPSDMHLRTPSSVSSYSTEYEQCGLAGGEASLPETRRLVDVYFAKVHPLWPILHPSTFEVEKTSKCLLGSMVLVAACHEGNTDHAKFASTLFSAVTGQELMSNPSLHLLQSLLLCVVYCLKCLREQDMPARATHLNAILISTCRSLGIFKDRYLYHGDPEQSPLSIWLTKEQLHRLAFSVFCVDSYISILLDYPPTVRYQELQIPLPMSTRLWEAASDSERRKLQWEEPAGRQKVLFSSIIRDVLEDEPQRDTPYQLDLDGSHLGLCALWSGVWEAAREAHGSAADELYAKHMPGSPFFKWRRIVSYWRVRIEKDCSLLQNHFLSTSSGSNTNHVPTRSALTLILGHLFLLHLHAPVKKLHEPNAPGDGTRSTASAESKTRLRTWLASPCSRIAVWHAAQISRVVEHEFIHRKSPSEVIRDPFIVPSLLTSAAIVCYVANLTPACHSCTGDPSSNQIINLFSVLDNDEKLMGWKESGVGSVCWGPDGILVCHCHSEKLVAWFRGYLVKSPTADAEFLHFVESFRASSI
ncbi:fungal-specific transcription factor domain-containing protein [Ustulina deusta]|nr:fungal-specific transcription factor domain-containing protein [Ustulina deusta]